LYGIVLALFCSGEADRGKRRDWVLYFPELPLEFRNLLLIFDLTYRVGSFLWVIIYQVSPKLFINHYICSLALLEPPFTSLLILLHFIFSSFFASYDEMNEYCGDRNVSRKLSTVDGNENFRRSPSPLVNGKLTLINLKYTCARI